MHVSFPLTASLGCRTYNQVAASSARNSTLDQQQIAFSVHAHYFEGLHGHALRAHMTGHFFALEYTTRSLALADRARDAVGDGVTVGIVLTTEIPALDRTLEAFTLGLTGYINQLTSSEDFSVDLIASLVLAFFKTEFHDGTTGGYVRFSEVASLSGCNTRSTTLADSDLHCTIAIGFFGFKLSDAIRLDLNDRDRNGDTFFGENTGHTAFTTDYTNSHVVNLMSVRGFHPLWPPISERYTTKTQVLAEADLNFHTGRKIKLHKRINGFLRWLDNVQNTLVSTDLVLVARVFVDVRRNQNGEPLFTGRQWNRTTHLCPSTFRGFHDFLG
ncbi:permease component [Pseudomonas syringae pv. actinidiae]|uniref:Permease component n=1 Tax=Pseudomonas syringae pv. actinidiae TaxID=103796 RepID=A0AAN4Q0M7_PSESF|nr:permease component [Pseudomonas syringae pv. actinidiae]